MYNSIGEGDRDAVFRNVRCGLEAPVSEIINAELGNAKKIIILDGAAIFGAVMSSVKSCIASAMFFNC